MGLLRHVSSWAFLPAAVLGCASSPTPAPGAPVDLRGAAVEIRVGEDREVRVVSRDPVEFVVIAAGQRIIARVLDVRSDTLRLDVNRSADIPVGGETLELVRDRTISVSVISREPERLERWAKRGAVGAVALFVAWGLLIFGLP